MQSLWQNEIADQLNTPLAFRVYTSRLLGQEPALVLHGGGNTSVKTQVTNLFGEVEEILYVKGSGWDLETIEAAGFAPVKMDVLLKMAQLSDLSDSDMVKYQRAAMIDPSAPNPSVEAILHAIIPFAYVDHTHADAIVTLTNTPDGKVKIQELYGKRVFVIPYVMPGFALAKLVYEMTRYLKWQSIEGIVLMNHGLFTFSDDAKTAYEKTIELVTEAEQFIEAQLCLKSEAIEEANGQAPNGYPEQDISIDLVELARIRKLVSAQKGAAQVALLNSSVPSCHIASHPKLKEIVTRGPLTPDHVIRTKRIPIIFGENIEAELSEYASNYIEYFETYQHDQTMLNYAPNFAIWQGKAAISFGKTVKEALIIEDITSHTFDAILTAEQLSQYQALSPQEIFEVEYWELEQAKLKKVSSNNQPLLGKVVMVTPAATEVRQAVVAQLTKLGANVLELNEYHDFDTLDKCQQAAETAVIDFGGLDILVCLNDDSANLILINTCEAFLKHGLSPTVLCVNHVTLPVMSSENINVFALNSAVDTNIGSTEDRHAGLFNLTSAITMMLSPDYAPNDDEVKV
ncbi:bifunctional aldolase/short-chain dehydrogenase [Shewanella sp. D64]|uniref:bifunctional aldolase/short-chain dehydrogenase n=1 Tax=unclassified Shewanella TaxID=196818 RepID=UPI0022BA1E97|nr:MULTISPECIES: bifunctional aldolase/short-chain dehydrogenase [unclassified Shewanella]MEC4725131.1 bifunctional aldolase/short-chain dehydrogenase [Shewanella sp. D64]MEC4737032.1 bifunctional aldolase/short-chain dehydrogenase [Shewanella sp. E94]WBJ96620.1 bifunctional aldolase/short-chain dehydrogenase [Shewanella sp. MTB7]